MIIHKKDSISCPFLYAKLLAPLTQGTYNAKAGEKGLDARKCYEGVLMVRLVTLTPQMTLYRQPIFIYKTL